MNQTIPSNLADAYRECEKLAFGHYENFPVASLLLSREVRPHVASLYAFARTADDFADEPPDSIQKNKDGLLPDADEKAVQKWRFKRLNQWDQQFKKAMVGKPAPLPLQAFAHTVKTYGIPTSLPLDLLRAFRMDVVARRWSTWNSLLYYCRHSANPVGRMVLMIHGINDEKLHRYSDFICTGLQLINFWQDTSIDIKRGRLYYPLQELRKAGVREKDLFTGKDSIEFRRMVQTVVNATNNIYSQGFPLLGKVGGRLGWELKATYLGGLKILDRIRCLDYQVLSKRPAHSFMDKFFLVFKALTLKEAPASRHDPVREISSKY